MTLYDEYMEITEEFLNEMPEEIADEIKSDVKRQESDMDIREIDALLKRRSRYMAMDLLTQAFQSGEISEEDFRQAMRRLL